MEKCLFCRGVESTPHTVIRYDKSNKPIETLWTCDEHNNEGIFIESLEDLLRAKYEKVSSSPDILGSTIAEYKILYEKYRTQFDDIEVPPPQIFANMSPTTSPKTSPRGVCIIC